MYIEVSEPYDREFAVVTESEDLRIEEYHMDRDRDDETGEEIISVRLVIIKASVPASVGMSEGEARKQQAERNICGQDQQAPVADRGSEPHCGWCGVPAAEGTRPSGANVEFSNRR